MGVLVLQAPLDDLLEEAQRLTTQAPEQGVTIRLFGGAAIAVRSPSARSDGLRRDYRDIDLAASSKQRVAIENLLVKSGYVADRSFNALHGHQRLIFLDPLHGRQIDVFFDRLRMCHTIEFGARLATDAETLPLAELLVFKLQIVETNQKDLVDTVALLGDHELGDTDGECINMSRLAQLTRDDWGLYHTVELSLAKVRGFAEQMQVELPRNVGEQVDILTARLQREPKTTRWKLRARVGERIPWYELPEEVRE
jgi:hypothetical protein